MENGTDHLPFFKSLRATSKENQSYFPEVALRRRSCEKVFWKYAADLHENAHAKVWFQ